MKAFRKNNSAGSIGGVEQAKPVVLDHHLSEDVDDDDDLSSGNHSSSNENDSASGSGSDSNSGSGSGSNSSTSGSSHSGSTFSGSGLKRAGNEILGLVRHETTWIIFLWSSVVTLMVVAAIYVGQATYKLAVNNVEDDFEHSVRNKK